jgi:N-acetylglucosamine-6-phosphate deacetylase
MPNIEELSELIDIGGGSIKMVTIAPELSGATETIKYLIQNGIKPALGHSDANVEQFQKGFTAGANLITHFTNAMKKERGSGTVFDLILNQDNVTIELILDGHHVNFENAEEILKKMKSQTILITDAMSATGLQDGNYKIGKKDVVVIGAVARLVDGNNLAGSTLTMEQAFKNAINVCNLNLIEAVHVSSTNAAKALGLFDRGFIKVGMRADLLTYNEINQDISRLDNI